MTSIMGWIWSSLLLGQSYHFSADQGGSQLDCTGILLATNGDIGAINLHTTQKCVPKKPLLQYLCNKYFKNVLLHAHGIEVAGCKAFLDSQNFCMSQPFKNFFINHRGNKSKVFRKVCEEKKVIMLFLLLLLNPLLPSTLSNYYIF